MITPVEKPPQEDGAEFGASAATPGDVPAKAVPWSRTSKWMVCCACVFVVGIPVSRLAEESWLPWHYIRIVQSVMLVACCILSPIAAWRSRSCRALPEHAVALMVALLSYGSLFVFIAICARLANLNM